MANDFNVTLGVKADGSNLQPQIDKLAKGLKNLDIKVDSSSLKNVSVTYDEIAKTGKKIQTINAQLINQQGQLLSATVKVDEASGNIISTKTKLVQSTKDETKAIADAAKAQAQYNAKIKEGKELASKQANDSSLSKQKAIYGEIVSNQKQVYSLKQKLISSDTIETQELSSQIGILEKRNQYLNYKVDKNGLSSSSYEKELSASKQLYENQLKINQARTVDKSINASNKQNEQAIVSNQKLADSMEIVKTRATTASNNFETYQKSLKSSALKDYSSQIDQISKSFKNAASSGKQIELSKANSQLSEFKSQMKLAGNETATLTSAIKSNFLAFSNWYIIAGVVSGAIGKVKELFTTVYTLDASVTDLMQATGKTATETRELLSTYIQLGQQLGATGVEVADAASSWLKQGKSLAETNTLIKDSLILSKIGSIESADATKYLTTITKSYGITAQDTLSVVDKLSKVDLSSATDVGGLASALNEVSSNAQSLGVNLDELLGYVAAIGETSGEEMSAVGNALNTMFSRMGNIKLKRLVDPTTGEDLSNTETSLRRVGIELRTTNDTFRDFSDVLTEVAGNWSGYNDVTKQSIAASIAGVDHINDFKILMSTFGKATEYTTAATNSSGTAMQKFQSYEQSAEAATKRLQASFESLAQDTIDSSLIKGFINGTNAIVQFADKTGILKIALAGLAGFGAFKGITFLATHISSATSSMLSYGTAIAKVTELSTAGNWTSLASIFEGLGSSQMKTVASMQSLTTETKAFMTAMQTVDAISDITNFDAMANAIKGLSAEQAAAILTTKGLNEVQVASVLTKAEVVGATEAQTVATAAFAASEDVATASTVGLGTALKALLISNPVGWVILAGTAIWGAVEAYDALTVSAEELQEQHKNNVESATSAIEEYEKEKTSLEDLSDKYDSNKEKLSELYSLRESQAITDAETAYLNQLEQENNKLEKQIEYQKTIEEADARKAEKKSVKALADESNTSSVTVDSHNNDGSVTMAKVTDTQKIKENTANITGYTQDLEMYEKAIHGVNLSFDEQNKLQSQNKYYKEQISKLGDSDSDTQIKKSYQAQIDKNKAILNGTLTYKEYSKATDELKSKTDKLVEENDSLIPTVQAESDAIVSTSGKNYELKKSTQSVLDAATHATSTYGGYTDALNTNTEAQTDNTSSSKTLLTSFSDIVSAVSNLSTGFDQLDKVYADVYNKEDFDWSSILNNADFAEAFSGMGSSYDNFIKQITSSPDDIQACQKAFDDLATSYLYSSGVLDNLTEGTKDATISMLQQMGISNADAIVTQVLAQQKQDLALANQFASLTGIDLTNATVDEINQLLTEGQVTSDVATQMELLAFKKQWANKNAITTSGDIKNLAQLATASSKLTQLLNRLASAKAAVENGAPSQAYASQIASLESQVNDYVSGNFGQNANPVYTGGASSKSAISSGSSGSSSSPSTEVADTTKAVEQTAQQFDFIQIAITRMTDSLSKLKTSAENTFASFKSRFTSYGKAINATTGQIQFQQQAYDTYMQKANAVGLSDVYKNQINSGSLNVEDVYDDTVKQQIQDYQSYYESAQKCQQEIETLKQTQTELTQAKIETLITKYENLAQVADDANTKIQDKIDLKTALGGGASAKDYSNMDKNILTQIKNITKQDTELKALQKTVGKGTEAWYKYQQEINKNKSSISQLTQKMVENATATAAIAGNKAKKTVEKLDSKDELLKAKAENATSASDKNSYISSEIDNISSRQTAYNTAVTKDDANIKSESKAINKYKANKKDKKLMKDIKAAIKSKKEISSSILNKITDKKLWKKCVQYNKDIEAKVADKEIADLYAQTSQSDKADLAQEQFNNVQKQYENQLSSYSQNETVLNNQIGLAEAQGKKVSSSYYNSLIANEQANQAKLVEERTLLQNQLASIPEGTDKWFEAKGSIDAVTNAIDESAKSLVNYANDIRQLSWDNFDDGIEKMNDLLDESDYYIELLSKEGDLIDKNGKLTDSGNATLALRVANYKTQTSEAKKYADEIARVRANDDLSSQTVQDHLKDLIAKQREATLSAEDEKQAMIDLATQGYEKQKSSLQDLISTYKDLMDTKSDMYDYQNTIADKTKTITDLQKQLSAYSGDMSEEAKSTVQKLTVSLTDAKKDLQETQYDKWVSDTSDMLDDLYNDYSDFIDDKLDQTNSLISVLIAEVASSTSSVGSQNALLTLLDSLQGTLSPDMIGMIRSLATTKATTNATGSSNIKSGLNVIRDDGQELWYSAADGSIMTSMGDGDKVFTNAMTDRLWNLASMSSMPNGNMIVNSAGGNTITVDMGGMVIQNATNAQEIVDTMADAIATNQKMKNLLQSVTVNTLSSGYNSLGSRVYK